MLFGNAHQTSQQYLTTMTIKLNPGYLCLTLITVKIFIGVYIQDAWIRPYGGGFLVVIFLYCLVRSFLIIDYRRAGDGIYYCLHMERNYAIPAGGRIAAFAG
jgi:hypothetical protein